MRNDIYPINHLPPVIPVGIQSEHGVREVRFDVSPWLEVWPGMYCEVWNTRPEESEAYRTVSVMEGDILTWNVNEVDTEKEGLGKVEIVGMTPDGERKKHAGPVDTAVKATSIAMTQEMPESHVPYYEALMASNADAKAVTGENARVAQEHKLNAGVSEENAKIYMNTASEKAKESAESAVEAAAYVQDSRKAAEDAGQHSNDAATSAQNAWEATKKMPIVGENGNWYVWSPSTGSYTDSGVPAQGPEGEKEMFFVTITTGSNGKLTSTQSYGNILYADQEGKFIVGRLDGAWPLEFVGSVEGGVMFRHIRYYSANANEPVICAEEFVVKPNGEVTWSTRTWEAPNPHSLTFTGATSATYDGREDVNVELPDVLVVTTSVVDGKHKANYTSEEFRAAYHNNIALLIMSQVCYIFSGYESLLPKFARPAFVTNMNRIRHEYATIGADGFITRTSNEYGIRNPQSLVFTGAVNATYDGGSRVTVNIPAGGGGGGGSIPDPGTAHQQLVSDADGKAVWNDRTHYTEYADVVVLEQTTLPVSADEGMAYLTEAPIAEPTDGGEYNVKWNGADYTCKAAKTEMDGIVCVMIGNAMAFGGDDTGEPFVALFLPADTAAALGAYAMIVPLDGSAEIVLSISGKSEVVHKLHEKYLPNLPTNLANGSTQYSLRQKSAAEEDAEYMLGGYASAFGYNTKAIGQQSHAEGAGTVASGDNAHAEGWDTKASSISAHAEGLQTTASGHYSHAEGAYTTASEESAHAEGRGSKATAQAAHAEGAKTTAEGDYSHAEGKETTASKESAHAEGNCTTAEGNYSHAEGDRTVASGSASHAEGHQSVASGINSHAEGAFAKASGYASHAEGSGTIASGRYQHVQGQYNVEDTDQYGKYAHIVGNGKDINNRSNAHTLDWDGNAWFAGDVYVGGDGQDDGERLVKASEFSALSEEMAGQTAPESFGAKGDGLTDDAEAITQALTSGQNVVFDGTKTYAVGSTITIPADSIVDFRGATIVPMGNHDVIRVKPGAHIENLVVRCGGVSGWDSSVLVFYGGDMFRGSSPTQLNNVKLYNEIATKGGNGLYLYADEEGQFVEGIAAVDVSTSGFTHGVHMHGKLPDGERLPSKVFIGANNFRNYWSFKDDIGVYIEGRLPNNHLTNNFFTNLNIQSDYYGGTTCGIYCTGFCNYFSGCLYDFLTKAADPTTAVFFDTGSQQNVLEVTDGLIHTPGYTVDKGGNNKVIKQRVDNFHVPYSSNGLGMSGNQDDALAFADKFADCVLESIDSEPHYGDLSSVFDPSPRKYLEYRALVEDSSKARAAITINLKKAMGEMTHFILQFKKTAPKSVKVTLYTATDTVVICNEKENYNKLIVVTPELTLLDDVYGVVKIVVELGGFTNSYVGNDGKTYGGWALERIMAVDSYNTGNAWLRRDGGELGGDLKFQQNKGPVLMDANGKKYMLIVSTDGVLGVTDYVEREEEAPEAAKLIPVMAAGPAWYNADLAGAAQNTITSVAFNANYEPTGSEDASWPCDEDGNGNIMAYRSGTAVTIKPTTGSDKIQLNPESSHMFANDGTNASFSALASITGTEMWVANKGTIMNRVCVKNERITQPVCIPAGVTYMNSAFTECYKLTTPPELPEGLVSLSNAFSQCIALQYLPELPSTVTNIEYAFLSCRVATKAPSVVPEKTMKMAAAFRNCQALDGTIEVNATNVTTYELCFLDTCKTSGSITLTGSSPYLAQLAATNTEGKVTVAS